MTGNQELHDDILGLEAQLAGKRMELALAQGDKVGGRLYMNRMNELVRERRAFRINVSESHGECFFDAVGQADRVAMGGGANA